MENELLKKFDEEIDKKIEELKGANLTKEELENKKATELEGLGYMTIKKLGKKINKEWLRPKEIPAKFLVNGIKKNGTLYPPEVCKVIKDYTYGLSPAKKRAIFFQENYGVDNVSQIEEIKKRKAETCFKHYGTTAGFSLESTKRTIKERYGVNNISQVEEIKEKKEETCLKNYGVKSGFKTDKAKKTMLEKYGVDNLFKLNEADNIKDPDKRKRYKEITSELKEKKRLKGRFVYNGVWFDSSWELAYYIYLQDHNIPFEYHPDKKLKYECNGIKHDYFVDFFVEGKGLIELKGDQFFDENDNLINPYDHDSDDQSLAKQKCMEENNVSILKEDDLKNEIKYVENKYNKNLVEYCNHRNPTKLLYYYNAIISELINDSYSDRKKREVLKAYLNKDNNPMYESEIIDCFKSLEYN